MHEPSPEALAHLRATREEEVFDQELSMDELDAAAGGYAKPCAALGWDDNRDDCVENHYRLIYGGGGFPNCAATVEDGSWCGTNDACRSQAVEYKDIKGNQSDNCKKAWH